MKFLIPYLLIINALGFLLMYVDKKNAMRRKRRIPERVLLGTAIIGGSLGVLVSMESLNHKTKHKRFRFVTAVSFIVHISILLLVIGSGT